MAVLRFVDGISASPTAALDLNDLSIWTMEKGTSFPPPPLKRTLTSSLLRDGETPGSDAYGNREITLVLGLRGVTADAAATQLQKLQRELDRQTNLLQYTPLNTTQTVFFRTFRSAPESIQWDPARRVVQVTILAEPFALGVREDISPFTVTNATTGLKIDLTGIKGDVETPLYMEYEEAASGLNRSAYAIGIRPGAAPYPTYMVATNTQTVLADTSMVADAGASQGTKSRTTFTTTPGNADRLSGYFPSSTASAANWGAYRVWARAQLTVGTDTVLMGARIMGTSGPSQVKLKNMSGWQMVDLGVFDNTFGLPTVGGYHNASFTMDQAPQWSVDAYRSAGSGSLDIDHFVLVPADYRYATWTSFGTVSVATRKGIVDGPSDAVYVGSALTAGSLFRTTYTTSISGALPMVPPGDSRMVVVEAKKGSAVPQPHLLTDSSVWTIRYWPRYLLVRPVAT